MIFKKNPLKETKILEDIITLYLISSINSRQNIIFQKSSYKKKTYYLKAKIPSATILYNESEHNILALVRKANKTMGEDGIHVTCLGNFNAKLNLIKKQSREYS
jgi:hypothetical protein